MLVLKTSIFPYVWHSRRRNKSERVPFQWESPFHQSKYSSIYEFYSVEAEKGWQHHDDWLYFVFHGSLSKYAKHGPPPISHFLILFADSFSLIALDVRLRWMVRIQQFLVSSIKKGTESKDFDELLLVFYKCFSNEEDMR